MASHGASHQSWGHQSWGQAPTSHGDGHLGHVLVTGLSHGTWVRVPVLVFSLTENSCDI